MEERLLVFGDQENRKRESCRLDSDLYNCPIITADTSIFLTTALDEPENSDIIRLTSGTGIIGAPEVLPYEIGNAFSAIYRRRKLTEEEATSALRIALGSRFVLCPWISSELYALPRVSEFIRTTRIFWGVRETTAVTLLRWTRK